MSDPRDPLLQVLRSPGQAGNLSITQWNLLLRQARQERMLARLGFILGQAQSTEAFPQRAREIFHAARTNVDFHLVQIKRELRRITRALEGLDTDILLLKGAAYLTAGLPLAMGRHMSDIDILIARHRLAAAESRLVQQGWEHQKPDSYDQRYYREWMHEIPPLMHPQHSIEVDIHHTLLPITARLSPDPGLLWKASVPLGDRPLRILAPTDMVLHSAAHLFYDGEIKGGLRDLIDLHQLFQHFGRDPRFWDALPERAEALQLARPLSYALRYCTRLLATPIPREITNYSDHNWAPPLPTQRLMDSLVERVLKPRLPEESATPISTWLLYVRSHWLRMPPWLLAKHLSRKAWRRMNSGMAEPT